MLIALTIYSDRSSDLSSLAQNQLRHGLYCLLVLNFCQKKRDVFRMENGPVLRFNHREIFIPSLCYFLMQREARVIFKCRNCFKHAAEASTFHLETRVAILSNSSLLTQLLCCAETNNKT